MTKAFKCSKCDRAFSMAAHLARHMNTIHGSRSAKAARKRATTRKKAATRKRVGAKRRVKARRVKRAGRPTGLISRLGLRNMTLEQLTQLIEAARAAGKQKLRDMQRTF